MNHQELPGNTVAKHQIQEAINDTMGGMRLVIAQCSVDYAGRLNAYLPEAIRLIMIKTDGSVLIHSEGGSYKPLNWMKAPVSFHEAAITAGTTVLGECELPEGTQEVWRVQHATSDDRLTIYIFEKYSDTAFDLGAEPGLIKDGVEADLQRLLAEQIHILGEGYTLIRQEYATAIGPVDILARDGKGKTVAVELKRRGEIDGVEQLTRYLEQLNRDPLLAPVTGIFAAQHIKPQAKTLAEDRGIRCITLDYDMMRGIDNSEQRLF